MITGRVEKILVSLYWSKMIHKPIFVTEKFSGKNRLQSCATLRPPTLRPVFKEIAKICHHKIFHFKAGFTIKFYFDSKLGTCHQRNRYLRNRIPRNNFLRNGILRNSHLRNRVLRNNYSRNKNPPQDFELHQSGVNL